MVNMSNRWTMGRVLIDACVCEPTKTKKKRQEDANPKVPYAKNKNAKENKPPEVCAAILFTPEENAS